MPTPTPIRTALTLGLTTSGAFAGTGLALSLGTVPLLLLAPTPTALLTQWRALYAMGLWIGPPGAVVAAACLGYASWDVYRGEVRAGVWAETHGRGKGEGEAMGRRVGIGMEGNGKGKGKGEGEVKGKWKPLALAAASCVAIVPFTWAFLAKTSGVLLRECEGGAVGAGMSEGVLRDMVGRWGWVCAVRALLPLGGTAVGVWSVLGFGDGRGWGGV